MLRIQPGFRRLRQIGFLASITWVATPSSAVPLFQGLGSLPNSSGYSVGTGISADGSTLVGTSQVNGIGAVAYAWTAASGMQAIGNFARDSWGYAASGNGQILAGTFRNEAGRYEAFRWEPGMGAHALGLLPGGIESRPFAMSADGSVVVGKVETLSGSYPFRWSATSGTQPLTVGVDAYNFAAATGVSADGLKAAGVSAQGGYTWTHAGGLEMLPGQTRDRRLDPAALSADGRTVVGLMNNPSVLNATRTSAFTWTEGQPLPMVLPPLVPDGFEVHGDNRATGVSSDGRTVVGIGMSTWGGERPYRAFVWTAEKGTRSVTDVLQQDYGLRVPAGWALTEVNGVSADGRTLVGTGIGPRGVEAWTARLPVVRPIQQATEAHTIPTQEIASSLQEFMRIQAGGQLKLYSHGGFANLTATTEVPRGKVYVLVHGWAGPGSSLSSSGGPLVDRSPWLNTMAAALKRRDSSAQVLAWDWTEFSNSSLKNPLTLAGCQVPVPALSLMCQLYLGDEDYWVPNGQVHAQAGKLITALGDALPVGTQVSLLGHSLGAGIVANTAEGLASAGDRRLDLKRITLFDAPENSVAGLVGGRVALSGTLEGLRTASAGTVAVENIIARGSADRGVTGYGTAYPDSANTALLGYSHFASLPGQSTPMDWYAGTITASAPPAATWGLGEAEDSLRGRYDMVLGNLKAEQPYELTILSGSSAEYRRDSMLRATLSWVDLANLATSGSAKELAAWVAKGAAHFEAQAGLRLLTNSPGFAFTMITPPEGAEMFRLQFEPEAWADGDTFVVAIDGIPVYWLDGRRMSATTMDTGLIDIERWADAPFSLTVGMLSDEPGHSVLVKGFGFVGTLAPVPEPATFTMLLFGFAVLGLQGRRRCLARFPAPPGT